MPGTRVCLKCQVELADSARFCGNCGRSVEHDDAAVAVLSPIVESILADGVIHPTERAFVATKGTELGVGEEVALAFLDRALAARPGVATVTPAPTADQPVEVWVNRSRALRVGEASVLAFEVRSTGDKGLEQLRIDISPHPSQSEIEPLTRRLLQPSQRLPHMFSFVPPNAGETLFKIRLSFTDPAGRSQTYRSHVRMNVRRPPDVPAAGSTYSVNIQAEKVMGVSADAKFAAPVQHPEPVDETDPDRWEKVLLWADSDAIEVPAAPAPVPKTQVMVPRWPRLAGARLMRTRPDTAVVHLVAKPRVTFGSSGELSDVALVLLQSSQTGHPSSGTLRPMHFSLEWRSEHLFLRPSAGASVSVDGQFVPASTDFLLPDRANIALGPSRLGLELRIIRMAPGPGMDVPTPALAAGLRRVGNAPELQYFLLHRSLAIGTGLDAGLVLDGAPNGSGEAVLTISESGEYALRATGSSGQVRVGGRDVSPSESVTLSSGAQVQVGPLSWTFSAFAC